MALFRMGAVIGFLRQHLPELPDAALPLASDVGAQAVSLGGAGVADVFREEAEPDPDPYLWDRDPFQPGLQLTSDPLVADVPGNLMPDVAIPDLPDDGLDAFS